MNKTRIENNTFRNLPGFTQFNACVGNNGNPGMAYYARGFMDAALELGAVALQSESVIRLDELVYPISFNVRHGLEVWLKHFLHKLSFIRSKDLYAQPEPGEAKIRLSDDMMVRTHDIKIFWAWFRFNSEQRDGRFLKINEQLDEYVLPITLNALWLSFVLLKPEPRTTDKL
ncbi:hypothetical protein [Pseudoalteromonas xiamenensis]|uniref:Uncharacterized protein n=1 Tax=Pseudoalteromonas xiamenensis TaxID=882626 RepID=A0A975HMB0_9GAMM|nr:hypothetical protein [Pseudoalteromonas xiamenensis]QTH72953.1 hypothetical protein J5O05_17470 [Pseudoalteromonas xiamenensis]